MKYLSTFGSLSIFTTIVILAMPQEVRAFDVEACYKNPMTTPQSIDLLQPLDAKMLNCIPELSSMASRWQSQANKIKSATDKFKIGNNGSSRIEKLEYNLSGNYVSFVVSTNASHTWKTPTVTTKVPVDKWRWVDVPYPDVRWNKKCKLRVCVKVPEPFTNYRKEKVPYVEIELRTTPEKSVSASATCSYNYTFNISTTESKPVFSCGRGALGEYKLDASAVTSMLKGEMPTMASLLQSVSITPPLFRDNTRDEYNNVRNDIISRHQGSVVYFSSESFVNWASVENQGTNIIIGALTAGSYSPELVRQLEAKMQSEVINMTTFTSQIGQQLVPTQIVSILTGNGSLNLKGFDISVKAVNTPKIIQKCMVQPTQRCLPEIKEPRLGFAIIATRKK
jgi:hypothetical protein